MDSTLQRAAELLARARLPVFGGLYTDIHGASAALALAETLGGVVDHAASEGIARAARVMRETGTTPASFGEVRNRADKIVIIGKAPLERDPDLLNKLFPGKPGLPRPGKNKREVVLLGAGKIEEEDDTLVLRLQQWDPGMKPRTEGPTVMKLTELGDNTVAFGVVGEGMFNTLRYTRDGDTFTISITNADGSSFDIPLTASR